MHIDIDNDKKYCNGVEIIKEKLDKLKFFPRNICPLKKMAQSLLEELVDKGKSIMRNELTAVLEEHRGQKGNFLERYTEIKRSMIYCEYFTWDCDSY